MTSLLSESELAALAEVVGKMTPGPWKVQGPWPKVSIYQESTTDDDWETHIANMGEVENGPSDRDPDASGIVALRNAAPALLAMARRAVELEAALRDALDLADDWEPDESERALETAAVRRERDTAIRERDEARRFLKAEQEAVDRMGSRNRALCTSLGITYPGYCDDNVWGGGALEMVNAIKAERDTALASLAAAMTVVEAACAWQAAWEAQWSAPDPDEHSDADAIATGTTMRAAIKSFRSRTKGDDEAMRDRALTLGDLFAKLSDMTTREDWLEIASRDVVMRVYDRDQELHVGGLTDVTLDAGCTETLALVLDGDVNAEGQPEEDL